VNFARASVNFSFAECERHTFRAIAICEFFPFAEKLIQKRVKFSLLLKRKSKLLALQKHAKKKHINIIVNFIIVKYSC